MNEIFEKIQKIGIVPVLAIKDIKDAIPIANALRLGGLYCAEITFRTDAACEAIKQITDAFPDMLIGAGTVLNTNQVDQAVAAGAKFIVSPGLNPTVVKYSISKNIPVIPGTSNPSDLEQAIELGLDIVKFFPAEASGGIKMIKAMSAPYGNIKFMPTGGINADNLNSYLGFPKIIACGGSWMVNNELIESGNFEKIAELTKEAVLTMLNFEVRHVGINCNTENEALKTTELFSKMFGFEQKIGNKSIFAGIGIEAMKSPYLGKNGHIAIVTNYIERAIYYLELNGFTFDYNTASYKNDKLIAIYLKDEISGFAVHLLQKN